MRVEWSASVVAVLALCAPLACGSGGGTPSSGIDRSRQVASLDDTERATLCDWANGLLGGYAHTITCGPGLERRSDATQMACTQRLAVFTGCDLSVGDYEICMRAIAATVCELNPGGNAPECEAYETCLGP